MSGQPKPVAYSYIRWSSDQQKEGDSLNRQTKAARDWAERNGYVLSEMTFRDSGVSAFKGRNVEAGDLALFLKAIEEGQIVPGSVLVLEHLDRMSRAGHRKAARLLEDILESGVHVATTSPERLYTLKDLDDSLMTTFEIIFMFANAHEESKKKSQRVKAAWDSNTAGVLEGTRIRTSRCPMWLRVVKGDRDTLEGATYEVVEEKAEILREIFQRFADGEGPTAIARDLNARGIPTFQHGNWRGPTISKLLKRESPYGHLEIGRSITEDEKSGKAPIPAGTYRLDDRIIEQIKKDVMPRVIDKEIERRVRFRLSNREAEVKAMGPVRNETRKTKACLTGVVKGDDGENLKRKAYARTAAYVSPVTNKYYGSVAHVDQVLRDYWPLLVGVASQTRQDIDISDLQEAIAERAETVEYLKGKKSTTPATLLRAENDLAELQLALKKVQHEQDLGYVDVPSLVDDLEAHEVNALVRKIVTSVTIKKSDAVIFELQEVERKNGTVYERRMPRPDYDLDVVCRNGQTVLLGRGNSLAKAFTPVASDG